MKKLILFLIFSFLFSSNSFAKIDSSYEKQIYEGCINDAKQNNDFNSASRKFCKCYANQFDKKFNNEQLINFLSKSDQVKAQIVQNEIAPPCYPKSKKKNSTNGSKITTLKKCYDIESLQNFEEALEVYGITEDYYEVNLKNETVSDVIVRNGATNIWTYPIKDTTSKLIATETIALSSDGYRYLIINLLNKTVEQHDKHNKIEFSNPVTILQCE